MNRLETFLHTDPRDAGCGRTTDLLHVYAELTLSRGDPQQRHPDVALHLRACEPCAEDLATLIAALRDAPH